MLDESAVDNTVLHLHRSSNPAPVSVCAFQGDWSLPSYCGCALLALYRALGSLVLGFCTLKDVPLPKAFQPITSKGTAWFSTHHQAPQGWVQIPAYSSLNTTSFHSCNTVVNPVLVAVHHSLSLQRSTFAETLGEHKTIALCLLREKKHLAWHLFPFSLAWRPCCLEGFFYLICVKQLFCHSWLQAWGTDF